MEPVDRAPNGGQRRLSGHSVGRSTRGGLKSRRARRGLRSSCGSCCGVGNHARGGGGRVEPGRQCTRTVPGRCAPGPSTSRPCQPPRSSTFPLRQGSSPTDPETKAERSRERPPAPPPAAPARGPQQQAEPDVPLGDLKPLNTQAQALVMSVVDERTLGPVTGAGSRFASSRRRASLSR